MNFYVEDAGGGVSRLVTETRVHATDAAARRRFAAYWRMIYPGSALLRVTWLRAIRARAEAPAPLPSQPVIVSTPFANCAWYWRSERDAGPFSTWPAVENCEPWQGQT